MFQFAVFDTPAGAKVAVRAACVTAVLPGIAKDVCLVMTDAWNNNQSYEVCGQVDEAAQRIAELLQEREDWQG